MVVKYKKKRLLFIKIFTFAVSILFSINLWTVIVQDDAFLNILTSILLALNCFGLLYFQNARYDDEKIMAQFGWPRVYYKDITSVKYVFGDILIKTEKRELGINTAYADKKSLDDFIEFLEQKTDFQLKLG